MPTQRDRNFFTMASNPGARLLPSLLPQRSVGIAQLSWAPCVGCKCDLGNPPSHGSHLLLLGCDVFPDTEGNPVSFDCFFGQLICQIIPSPVSCRQEISIPQAAHSHVGRSCVSRHP